MCRLFLGHSSWHPVSILGWETAKEAVSFTPFYLLINRDSLFFLLSFRSGISGLERESPAVSFKQTKTSELSSLQRTLAVQQEEYF